MLLFKLDYTIDKILSEQLSSEQIFLKQMFHIKVAKNEAKTFFERILDHKWYVSERLGRDIGLPVAAMDFVTNIEGLPSNKRKKRKINRFNKMKLAHFSI